MLKVAGVLKKTFVTGVGKMKDGRVMDVMFDRCPFGVFLATDVHSDSQNLAGAQVAMIKNTIGEPGLGPALTGGLNLVPRCCGCHR